MHIVEVTEVVLGGFCLVESLRDVAHLLQILGSDLADVQVNHVAVQPIYFK